MTAVEFKPFPSIGRLARDCIVTEKIDGTNGVVFVSEDGGTVLAGSRNQWIGKDGDGFGFLAWVQEHAVELVTLGPGYHYGEWWGHRIQRGYGVDDRRFSLFNVGRWGEGGVDAAKLPACCGVVPVLYRGAFDLGAIDLTLAGLVLEGSVAAPNFMNPEGIVVWHEGGKVLFKKTLGGDGHKGARR